MKTTDPTRRQVWMTLADQFLDTEVRHEVPVAAGLLVRAGYSLEEARRIWRYEVTPAVWPNAWDIAGEWAGWPEDWLVERIERLRGRWPNREGPVAYLVYRLRVHLLHRVWLAIEATMQLLERLPCESRESTVADLEYLARVYFDFRADEPLTLSSARQRQLLTLFERDFRAIVGRVVFPDPANGESKALCRQRVIDALATAGERRSA